MSPTGEEFKEFVSAYCWVHGTIPFRSNERLPIDNSEWEFYEQYRRISKSLVMKRMPG